MGPAVTYHGYTDTNITITRTLESRETCSKFNLSFCFPCPSPSFVSLFQFLYPSNSSYILTAETVNHGLARPGPEPRRALQPRTRKKTPRCFPRFDNTDPNRNTYLSYRPQSIQAAPRRRPKPIKPRLLPRPSLAPTQPASNAAHNLTQPRSCVALAALLPPCI
jgi:hypothetical protein